MHASYPPELGSYFAFEPLKWFLSEAWQRPKFGGFTLDLDLVYISLEEWSPQDLI